MKDRIRDQYYDLIKGVLIILVVFGHILPETNFLHIYIYSFHMPAFFIVNGMLLNHTAFTKKTFFGRKGVLLRGIKAIMIPYCIYAVVLSLTRWVFAGFDLGNLKWQVIDFFSLSGIGATWFLPCLFIGQVITFAIILFSGAVSRKIPFHYAEKIIILFIGIVMFFCAFYAREVKGTLVFIRACIAGAFILIGYCFYEIINLLRTRNVLTTALVTIGALAVHICAFHFTKEKTVAINSLHINNPFTFLINAILGSLVVILLCVNVEKIPLEKCKKALSFYGKNSLTIMGTHQILMLVLFIPIVKNYLLNVVFTLLILAVEFPIILIQNKLKKRKRAKSGETNGKRS